LRAAADTVSKIKTTLEKGIETLEKEERALTAEVDMLQHSAMHCNPHTAMRCNTLTAKYYQTLQVALTDEIIT